MGDVVLFGSSFAGLRWVLVFLIGVWVVGGLGWVFCGSFSFVVCEVGVDVVILKKLKIVAYEIDADGVSISRGFPAEAGIWYESEAREARTCGCA
jgi:hypothetical protein